MSNMWPVEGKKNVWVVGWRTGPRQRKWKRVRGDRAAAERIQRHLQTEADLRSLGVIDPSADRAAQEGPRPLKLHVADFVQHIRARGRADRYIQQVEARLERFVAFVSVDHLSGITADRVDGFIVSLRAARVGGFAVRECVAR